MNAKKKSGRFYDRVENTESKKTNLNDLLEQFANAAQTEGTHAYFCYALYKTGYYQRLSRHAN